MKFRSKKSRRSGASLRAERLELRQLLAGDFCDPGRELLSFADGTPDAGSLKADVKAGSSSAAATPYSYQADGREIGMSLHPSRLAVGFESAGISSVDELFGEWSQVRGVTGNIRVYESAELTSAEMEAAVSQLTGVTVVSPVFVVAETQSEAVLLDEVVVALQPGVDPVEFFGGFQEISSYRNLGGTNDQFVVKLSHSTGASTLAMTASLNEAAGVRFASPNFYQNWQKYYMPNDPLFGNQWHLNNTGQSGGLIDADQDLPEAWGVIQGGSTDIVIGVMDDGVEIVHEDINNWENPGEVWNDLFDNDSNGWVDDFNGWNVVSGNSSSQPTATTDSHGTSVAGVAAAKGDNGIGVAGASYGSPVMSVKMFEGANVANDAQIAEGFYYLAGRTFDGSGTWDSADVVNNSWGGGAPSTTLSDALIWGTTNGRGGLGLTYLFATGNGFAASASYPALYSETIPGIVGVGATNNFGFRSAYSNYGPGLDIMTSSNGYVPIDGNTLAIETTDRMGGNGYNALGNYTGNIDDELGGTGFGGTSSATPLATGITALLLAQADVMSVTLTPPEIHALLRANTDLVDGASHDPTTGENFFYGAGALNAASLVSNVGKAEISVLSATTDLESGVDVVDFGSVILGASTEMTLRVRNQGTSALDLTGLSVSGAAFTLQEGFGASTLQRGEATTFTIRYEPLGAGTPTGTVTLNSSDADEGVFTFDLTGEVLVPSIAGYAFEDGNSNGQFDPWEMPIVGALSYIDANDNDLLDTSEDTFSISPGANVPDPGTLTSDLIVSGLSAKVIDVNVTIDISHTWNSDLDVTLIAPDGTRVLLLSNVGGSSDNFTDTTFDDSAPAAITEGTAPFTGSFRPMQALSSLIGMDGNGTWSLEVTDFVSSDAGVLNDWSLTITTGEDVAITDAAGYYSFFNLPLGTHTVRQEAPAGWTGVTPLAGEYTRTFADPGDYFIDNDFGSGQNDHFYGHVFNDLNGDGVVDPGELPLEGRFVFVDSNGNGTFEQPATGSYVQPDDVAILDVQTVTSDLVIAGFAGTVADLNVRLNITHTYVSDMEITLTAPGGTVITLFDGQGGSGDNLNDTWFDDDAATGIAGGTAPFAGTFRPVQALSAFNGIDPNGTWTLSITDNFNLDQGTLNEWEIFVAADGEVGMATDVNGNAVLEMTPGTYDLVLEPQAGWAYTVPVDGTYNETASGVPMVGRAFGTVEQVIQVVGVQVAGGATQRSMVTTMDVTFDGEVDIAPDAFLLENTTTAGTVTVDVTTNVIGGQTVATLTFVGGAVLDGSLIDGNYLLTIDATKVTDALSGSELDGDGDGQAGGDYVFGADEADNFFRLLGDGNGSRGVNFADFLGFRAAYGKNLGDAGYVMWHDYNQNGAINFQDFLRFRSNYNKTLPFS